MIWLPHFLKNSAGGGFAALLALSTEQKPKTILFNWKVAYYAYVWHHVPLRLKNEVFLHETKMQFCLGRYHPK